MTLTMRVLIFSFALHALAAPTVTITNGTVVGSTSNSVDTFNGIPYAQQPTGTLRLRLPLPLATPFGTFQAVGKPKSCPQYSGMEVSFPNGSPAGTGKSNTTMLSIPANVSGIYQSSILGSSDLTSEGEDCLTLNVQRPSDTTANSKLPVLVYIYGGGFYAGTTNDFDAKLVMATASQVSNSTVSAKFVHVAMNYRVGAYGFLPGAEIKNGGVANIGLRDQRLALQWVQDNIGSLGGDPNKVTIMGESAGSVSVWLQMVGNGGDNTYKGQKLFRAAIMDSGSVIPTLNIDHPKAQSVYNQLVSKIPACAGLPSTATLDCLRGVPFQAFQAAANNISRQGLNGPYFPRPDPSSDFYTQSSELSLAAGNYTRVPIIIGNQEDEGTAWGFFTSLLGTEIKGTQQIVEYFRTYFPDAATTDIQSFVDSYSTNAADGSPFRTGLLNELYPGYKRFCAILGDIALIMQRRFHLNAVSNTVPSWSYLQTHLHSIPWLGTLNGSDVALFYNNAGSALGLSAETMRTYYISFVNHLDPNRITSAQTHINWPLYNTSSPNMLNMDSLSQTVMQDTFRSTNFDALSKYHSEFKV